jgi:hypothetical protein
LADPHETPVSVVVLAWLAACIDDVLPFHRSTSASAAPEEPTAMQALADVQETARSSPVIRIRIGSTDHFLPSQRPTMGPA